MAATLVFRQCLGIKPNVQGSCLFLDDTSFVYAAGTNAIIYSFRTKEQKCIPGSASLDGISCFAVSQGGKFLAVAEHGEIATISIYDVKTLKRRGQLRCPDFSPVKIFSSISFSADTHLLLAQGEAPDYPLLCWNWSKNALVVSQKDSSVASAAQTEILNARSSNMASAALGVHHVNSSSHQLGSDNPQQGSGAGAPPSPSSQSSPTNADPFDHPFSSKGAAPSVAQTVGQNVPAAKPEFISPLICSFCPGDSTLACVSGWSLLKFYRIVDNSFRSLPAVKHEVTEYTSHIWLRKSSDLLVASTGSGELVLFKSGEQNKVFSLPEAARQSHNARITALTETQRSLVIVATCGSNIFIYEDTDLTVKNATLTLLRQISRPEMLGEHSKILSMGTSPDGDRLICAVSTHQICMLDLSKDKLGGDIQLTLWDNNFHTKGERGLAHVTGLDTCSRKPLLVTSGVDKTVRIFNYGTNKEEISKTFTEEAFSAALHPSGLQVIVGFTDKLRLMTVLADDLKVVKEFPVKACRECKFSNGGQYFAAVSGNQIHVYSVHSGEPVASLRGHNGKVRSLFWTQDDSTLLSAGADGAIYQWSTEQYTRESEWVRKGVIYGCAVCLQNVDKKGVTTTLVYAVSSDGKLKEIELPTAQIIKEIDCNASGNSGAGGALSGLAGGAGHTGTVGVTGGGGGGGAIMGQIIISRNKKMIFTSIGASGRPGKIRSLKFAPLEADSNDYTAFSLPVTRLRLSHDDQFLFCCGEDGLLYIFEIRDHEGRRVIESLDEHSDEVLINRVDLEEKAQLMSELRGKVEELKVNNEYQLRLKDMAYSERIKEITDKYTKQLEEEQAKYESLRDTRTEMDRGFALKYKKLEGKHLHDLHDLEAKHQKSLIAEVDRYRALSNQKSRLIHEHEDAKKKLAESHMKKVSDIHASFDGEIRNDRGILSELEKQNEIITKQCGEVTRQLEEDVDTEIFRLRSKYQQLLNTEKETSLRFKGENGIMKKKFAALQTEIEEQGEQMKAMQEKEQQLASDIRTLNREIDSLKREIRTRDDAIGDKERRIFELKKKNQELEKFKFVLDYKIKELKQQIEPREREIKQMKQQIKDMDAELERYHKANSQLDDMIGDLRKKLDVLQGEIIAQRRSLNDQNTIIHRFQGQLEESVTYIQDPDKLRNAVVELCARHSDTDVQIADMDMDIEREYGRQRDHLRKTVETLQKVYGQEMKAHERDNQRIVNENLSLIKEITGLRSNVQTSKHKFQQAMSLSIVSNVKAEKKRAAEETEKLKKKTLVEGKETVPLLAAKRDAEGGEFEDDDDPKTIIEQQREHLSSLRDLLKNLEDALNKYRQESASIPNSGRKLATDAKYPVVPLSGIEG